MIQVIHRKMNPLNVNFVNMHLLINMDWPNTFLVFLNYKENKPFNCERCGYATSLKKALIDMNHSMEESNHLSVIFVIVILLTNIAWPNTFRLYMKEKNP